MDLPLGISTLQRTDRWIGAPFCGILTILRRIFEPAGPPGAAPVRRILFVKFAEQGSTVLAYPAIRRAIDMVGRENIYFVVFEDNRFIPDTMEVIPEENVIMMTTHSPFGLALSALRAVRRVRKIGIDAVVDMEFLTRFSAMLSVLTTSCVRAGDAGAICHAIAKRDRAVGQHRVQSVRECLQQPVIGLPQQSLYASNHS